jgi:hypothetical protein
MNDKQIAQARLERKLRCESSAENVLRGWLTGEPVMGVDFVAKPRRRSYRKVARTTARTSGQVLVSP